ncbi:hypothetical protein NE865_06699 [Phthorimaea operculella]|nr:hypothetical protein NE865_06699 [Phthorimaea operculella]
MLEVWVPMKSRTQDNIFITTEAGVWRRVVLHKAAGSVCYIGLAPACYMTYNKSPIVRVLAKIHTIAELLVTKLIGLHEFVPRIELVRAIKGVVCGNSIAASTACSSIFYMLGGFNFKQQNDSQLPVIMEHIPSSIASRQLLHYAQLLVAKTFQEYDYGPRNHEVYGSDKPPLYPLERISAPVAIIYGDGDWLVSPEDSETLRNRLPNVVENSSK